ncbi:hypothetical protein [Rhizobium bangladeshense]|uniref:hypothetical protein n=1 Tax=Rhizobium bangladeshense TaxID=1138189 RepID=UPI001FDA2EA3|nr:hypothetical protein [Rhizobium bangladeshense]
MTAISGEEHKVMTLRAELTALPPREQARHLTAVAACLVEQIRRTEPYATEAEAALASAPVAMAKA